MSWSLLFISIYFSLPFIVPWAINRYPKRTSSIKVWLKNRIRLFVLMYFYSISAFVNTSSSFFIELAKPKESNPAGAAQGMDELLMALLAAIDRSGFYLIAFMPIVVASSFFTDKIFDKLSQYKFHLGGYWDPATKEENISLRLMTFGHILAGTPNRKNLGMEVGRTFAETIRKEAIGNDAEKRLQSFIRAWNSVDEKAGWFETIEFNSDHQSVVIKNPFCFHFCEKSEQYKQEGLSFLEGYVQGAIENATDSSYTIASSKENKREKDNFVIFNLNERKSTT